MPFHWFLIKKIRVVVLFCHLSFDFTCQFHIRMIEHVEADVQYVM